MWISSHPIVSLMGVGVALSIGSVVSAQEFRATVTGRVTDPNGLVVPRCHRHGGQHRHR